MTDPGNRSPGSRIPAPPTGWAQLAWLGPGFLWMVSAAGSGELLFTPRVGALYGYALVWALLAAVAFKWFINREIGRYTVCTGEPLLTGFARLPGRGNWAVWVILVPQVVVAVATIAGLASSAATALILVLPGNLLVWTVVSVLASAALVLWGHYKGVERVAASLAVALALASVAAAVVVFPSGGEIARGVVPTLPGNLAVGEVLPWIGFMLSGAAGLVWYSYWLHRKGYGAAGVEADAAPDPRRLDESSRRHLRGWIRQMTFDNTVAVVGTLFITLAFLVLGAELLRPRGLIPEEARVAPVLGRLLGEVWGPVGFWFMILAVYVGFWDTVLSDQDGFGRMFADGTRVVLQPFGVRGRWVDLGWLKRFYVGVLVTALPLLLFFVQGEPVALLKLAGAVEAAHIPFVTGLVLYLNRQRLPKDLQASWPVFGLTVLAGLFFLAFSVAYVITLLPS